MVIVECYDECREGEVHVAVGRFIRFGSSTKRCVFKLPLLFINSTGVLTS